MSNPVPDQVILGLLKIQPSHGYDLLERFQSKDQLGHIWRLSTSQLYAVLKRLEESGAIQGIEVANPDAPPRREYQLLPVGEQQLTAWLEEEQPSASLHRIRVFFLSRLFIARQIDHPVHTIFHNQIKACQKQRDKFLKDLDTARNEITKLTLDLVVNQLSAVIEWLKHQEKTLTE